MDREKVDRGMAERNLEAVISFLPENILFFSRCWPSTNAAVLVPPGERPVLIVSRPDEEFVPGDFGGEVLAYNTRLEDDPPGSCIANLLRQSLKKKRLDRGRAGCDRSMETVAATHIGGEAHVPGPPFYTLLETRLPGLDLIDCTSWIRELRMIKTPAEIESIRRCNEIVDHALARAKESLEAGMKETELAALIESAIQTYGVGYRGVKRARGFAFVMSGPKNTEEAWGAFNVSTDRRLQNGDLVLIELDSQADGYWSDISRTFVVGGRPDGRQQEIHSIVRDSQQRAVEALRPGMRASEVDRVARAAIAERGYGKNFLHHVGHGTGFAFHEMPYLDPPSRLAAAHDYEIQPGMVLAIEPAIYIESWGGVRLEDNVAVTAQGRVEYLSLFDREL